ncbi:SDR family oxidoreductase [Virgibacillus sp. NKC19-3]|uniref:SDR family oxidoreductase n=1 Tax=Virgibacillus saliphilus TaxID=2831674 RepID=UPI001C9B1726|nr:SDR family oxidoreductase [Virgibacillus sp. NKC19-3]MBY7142807.1 SDR family oxidoreductase [Virgibacillus sp. NKC19-3]
MDLDLKGKSVIVTAASKGLGKATAKKFAEEGARVLISSRSEGELEKAQEEIQSETGNDNIDYTVCDITDSQSIKELVSKAVKLNGTVDVLINNAGGPPPGTFDKVDDNDWQSAFELNLLSFVRTIREVLPYMRKQGHGHIINLASSSIKQPIDNLILSNTFRAGIVGLSKSLSQELAQDNILINTIGPGRIGTDRVAQLDNVQAEKLNKSYEEIKSQSEKSIPIGRYGKPEEFANMVVYLCSGANTYITGQSLLVDGGMVKAL